MTKYYVTDLGIILLSSYLNIIMLVCPNPSEQPFSEDHQPGGFWPASQSSGHIGQWPLKQTWYSFSLELDTIPFHPRTARNLPLRCLDFSVITLCKKISLLMLILLERCRHQNYCWLTIRSSPFNPTTTNLRNVNRISCKTIAFVFVGKWNSISAL